MQIEELVEGFKCGDKVAERQLFDKLFVIFQRFAKYKYRTLSPDDWKDIAQEACIEVCKQLSEGKSPVYFMAWARKIVINKAGNHWQKVNNTIKLISGLPEDEKGIKELPTNNELLRKALIECLMKLVSKDKEYAMVLELARLRYPRMNAREISLILGKKENNVRIILDRARDKISNCLKGKGFDYE
jgi:RNA polymerase sigma factor (sigma-70 family)